MMQPSASSKLLFRSMMVAMTAMAVLAPMRPVSAHARRPAHRDLVRCTSVRQPIQSGDAWNDVDRVLAHGVFKGRFFAPTRQAVFYAHAGDRCAWHAGTLARG